MERRGRSGRNIEITSFTTSRKDDSDENVPEAEDTADGVGDVMLGTVVERDEDGAEIMEYILSFDNNVLISEQLEAEAGIQLQIEKYCSEKVSDNITIVLKRIRTICLRRYCLKCRPCTLNFWDS